MTPREYGERLHAHVQQFFAGHAARAVSFEHGPIQRLIPAFHVIEVDPGQRHQLTTYVSVGAGYASPPSSSQLEFVITAAEPAERHVELLAMTAHYHLTGEKLGLGHTLPIGGPWLPGSSLDHLLVSLPYPFGPKLELFEDEGCQVQLLWLLPITESERDHKRSHGLESLEQRFDAAPLPYWDPTRRTVA